MSQRDQSAWDWDPRRQQYFYYNSSTQEWIYRDGLRIPRTVTQASQATPSGQGSTHRTYSQGSQGDAYTHRPQGLVSPTSSPPVAPRPSGSRSAHPTASPSGLQQTPVAKDQLASSLNSLSIAQGGPQTPQGQQHGQQRRQSRSSGGEVQVRVANADGMQVVNAINPGTQVRSTYAIAPADRITDRGLASAGVQAEQMILPTEGETERLYSSYSMRKNAARFFVVGRVFMVLWAEPAGENSISSTIDSTYDFDHEQASTDDPNIVAGRYGERIYSKVRRFVVIRAGINYCSALPIVSYGRRGVGKPNVVKSEHAIIYTSEIPPTPLPAERPARNEDPMRAQSIRVVPDSRTIALDVFSRIDFGKVFTVHHNIKVKAVGMVHEHSRAPLLTQFANVFAGVAGLLQSDMASSSQQSQTFVSGESGAVTRAARSTAGSSNVNRRESSEQSQGFAEDADREQAVEAGPPRGSQRLDADQQAAHQAAIRCLEAYNRLTTTEPRHTPQQAMQAMVGALRRQHPTLNNEQAAARISGQLQYARRYTAGQTG